MKLNYNFMHNSGKRTFPDVIYCDIFHHAYFKWKYCTSDTFLIRFHDQQRQNDHTVLVIIKYFSFPKIDSKKER